MYLRGRYELQIDNSGDEPYKDVISSIYGFIPPSEIADKGPNEWQSYDVTLVGRLVTVVFNGKTVICNREIRGITGGAINSKEGEPVRYSFKVIMVLLSIEILLLLEPNRTGIWG